MRTSANTRSKPKLVTEQPPEIKEPDTSEVAQIGEAQDDPLTMITVPKAQFEALQSGGRKLYVSFVYSRGAAQEFSGIYIAGMSDLRTQAEIENVTKLLAEKYGAITVTLLSWKSLDA